MCTRYAFDVAQLLDHLVGRLEQRAGRGLPVVVQEPAGAAAVHVQVRHQEDHGPVGQREVETERRVVEDGNVGRQYQVVDLGVAGHVEQPGGTLPATRAGPRVEPVAAQQEDVLLAERLAGGLEIEVADGRRRAVARGEVVTPRRGVEHSGLLWRDSQALAGSLADLRRLRGHDHVVAWVAVAQDRSVVAVLTAVVLVHLGSGRQDQVPVTRGAQQPDSIMLGVNRLPFHILMPIDLLG